MFGRSLLILCCAAVFATAAEIPLLEQSAPNSAWLDFASAESATSTLPEWCEALQTLHVPATEKEPPKTIHRLRLHQTPTMQRDMLLRVMFDDIPGLQPVVSAWTETGRERFRSQPLGTALGLPTQDDVIVPLAGTDYIDIEVTGDASNVRCALATAIKEQLVRQPLDFPQAGKLTDPFGNLPPLLLDAVDTKLFGRVKATLEMDTVPLAHGATEEAAWSFDLEAQPLAAMVTFEILNADLSSPPIVYINGEDGQIANVQWPDLADPGFRGEARGSEAHVRFHYTGWLRAQVAIPAGILQQGLNNISVALSDDNGPFAIRNVELQLKQNWKHFDYILTPDR